MDDEKKVLSFSFEELKEAEELNARAETRMTEEYRHFLEEHFGGEGNLYEEHIGREKSVPCFEESLSGDTEDFSDEDSYESGDAEDYSDEDFYESGDAEDYSDEDFL